MMKRWRALFGGLDPKPRIDVPVDLTSAAFIQDPAPIYAKLRLEQPIAQVASGGFLLTRHSDVLDALSDTSLGNAPSRFSVLASKNKTKNVAAALASHIPPFQDKPDHIPTRQMVSRAFHDCMKDCADWIEELVQTSIADVRGQKIDLIEHIARPYVCQIMSRFVGLPYDERAIKATTNGFFHLFAPISDRETLSDVEHALAQARTFIASSETKGGFLAKLLDAGMDREAAIDNAMLILADGVENVEAAIAMTFDLLCANGVTAHQGHFEASVQEALRLSTPGQIIPRVAREDTHLHGQKIGAGTPVFLALGSANLDPNAHADPKTFCLDRKDEKSVVFGLGRHSCIGSPLAMLQISALVRALLDEGITRVDANPLRFHKRFGHRWPMSMPVQA